MDDTPTIFYIYRFFGRLSRTYYIIGLDKNKKNTTKRVLHWCMCVCIILILLKTHRIVIYYVVDKKTRVERHILRSRMLTSCWFLCAWFMSQKWYGHVYIIYIYTIMYLFMYIVLQKHVVTVGGWWRPTKVANIISIINIGYVYDRL